MLFFLIFISIPLIEIALFITVGGAIGAGPTLLLCIINAIIGFFILQKQGIKSITYLRAPSPEALTLNDLFDGLCRSLAGALLIVPGFFTDIVALALLAPPVRHFLLRRFGYDLTTYYESAGGVIDAEFERIEAAPRPVESSVESPAESPRAPGGPRPPSP